MLKIISFLPLYEKKGHKYSIALFLNIKLFCFIFYSIILKNKDISFPFKNKRHKNFLHFIFLFHFIIFINNIII